MRPQVIIDCGRVISAILVTAERQLVPCSQEIRQVATRHLSADVLFDPRASEHPDFVWEEALEMIAKSTPRTFFQRAQRAGLRRPWDPRATADVLRLASPITVLSSAAALADRNAAPALPAVTSALLDALLEPAFAFVADRRIEPADLDPVIVVPAHASRAACLLLEKVIRRRGFTNVTIIRREIAAAMALIEDAPAECIVIDAGGDDLHVHRIAIEADDQIRRFRTVVSATARDLGWSYWSAEIASALNQAPSAAFERRLLALLTGSPESLGGSFTYAALQSVLDDAWIAARSRELRERLREPLERVGAVGRTVICTGEIFAIDAVHETFGVVNSAGALLFDRSVRGVASALLWLHGGDSRRLAISRGGTLRLDSGRGDTVELLAATQLPEAGEVCHVTADFRFAGDAIATSFLLNLQWGSDDAPEGNATLCAVPLELRADARDGIRLTVKLRRSRTGRRLSGSVEARMWSDVVAGHARFAEQLEVMK